MVKCKWLWPWSSWTTSTKKGHKVFFFPWIKLSWNSCLCETNLVDSIHSGNFSATGYLPFIWEDSNISDAWFCSFCEGRPSFTLELQGRLLLMFLTVALLDSVSYFVFLLSPSLSLYMVFDSISFNIDEVLSINPSAVFIFGGFNAHDKDWSIKWLDPL